MPDEPDVALSRPSVERGESDMPLEPDEVRQAEEREAPSALVLYEVIYTEAVHELQRPAAALFWSGLAAGTSLGFSMIAVGLIASLLPDAPWAPLVSRLGYTVGFLVVILGRQQLFTENTLTPVIPLLRHPSLKTLLAVARLWGVVLAANLLGTLLFAWLLGMTTDAFDPAVFESFVLLGEHLLDLDFGTTFATGLLAGWLLALLVWMLPYAETEKVTVIIIITYLIGLGGFAHCITGSVEAMYAVMHSSATWGEYVGFLVPALLGNIVGGVAFVAVINHGQAVAGGR